VESPGDDLVLVQINPSLREGVPTTARDIMDRTSEITFNASLLKEMRNIGLLKRLIQEEGGPGHQRYSHSVLQRIDRLRLHRIEAEAQTSALGASSKMNTRPSFLARLHDIGVEAADAWLARNGRRLGRESTIDVVGEFAP